MNRRSDVERKRLNSLSEKIIGCAFRVSNGLGPGFVEKVYENALAYELSDADHLVKQQEQILVHYRGTIVGDFCMDLIVDDSVIVEVKAVSELTQTHISQCLNYLKATELSLGLLINFGKSSVQVKRLVNGF